MMLSETDHNPTVTSIAAHEAHAQAAIDAFDAAMERHQRSKEPW